MIIPIRIASLIIFFHSIYDRMWGELWGLNLNVWIYIPCTLRFKNFENIKFRHFNFGLIKLTATPVNPTPQFEYHCCSCGVPLIGRTGGWPLHTEHHNTQNRWRMFMPRAVSNPVSTVTENVTPAHVLNQPLYAQHTGTHKNLFFFGNGVRVIHLLTFYTTSMVILGEERSAVFSLPWRFPASFC